MEKNEDIYQNLIDYIKKESNPEQNQEVESWIADNDANRKEYRQMVKTFYKLKFSGKWDGIDSSAGRTKLEKHLKKERRLRIYRYSAVAASIAILISFGLIFFVNDFAKESEQLPLSELSSPGEFKATLTLSTGEKVLLSEATKDSLQDAGALINHDIEEGINYQSSDKQDSLIYNILRVARGEEYKVILADGSSVWLNSESELKYPVAFVGDKREVFVKGEAYFDVAHNKEKTFIVHAGDVQTKVLGTEFNVMAYNTEENIEVTLVEGKVNVAAGESNTNILPGKQVAVEKSTLALTEKSVDTRLYSSWKDGIIYFDEMSLEKLTEKLSRWYNIDFEFSEERLKHYAFTGAVKKRKPIEFTLDFLRTTSNLKFTVEGDKIVVFELTKKN
jgi:ferric-dicitrate binding protein FerR (iron transport regulator)